MDRPDDEALDDLDDLEKVWDLGLQDLFAEATDDEVRDPRPGDHCGRYRLVEEIAQGGMGRVFRATDERLERDVAVKILRERLRRDEQMTARFLEEARIAARLQHPGIVPVYDVGLDRHDRPWFSMKLVEGRTLAEILRERRSPADELARFLGIFAAVCQAVSYAHVLGVIHRDLKPANVMIGPFGEVQVLDWGFAKVLDALRAQRAADRATAGSEPDGGSAGSSRSVSGSVLGTPRYMSPEQARGEIENLDRRTDVFALGGILCEILGDEPPWGRDGDEPPIERAARGDLAHAERALAASGADRELVDLARRCLAIAPAERPADAGEVARELTDYLAAADERTRRARVAAEAALASAAHERRARVLTLVLGGVLFAAAAGILYFLWRADVDRRDELARRREKLRIALADASDHAREAEWPLAEEAIARGRALLGDAPPRALELEIDDAAADLARRRAAFETAEAERLRLASFRERLDEIRLTPMEEPGQGGEDYAACFADFGCPVVAHSPEMSYLELVKLPAEVQETIRLALDDWASRERAIEARRPVQPETSHSLRLLQLAQFLDRDPWRRRLRAAVIEKDEEELERIAEEASRTPVEAKDAILLATTLQRGGKIECAIAVLRTACMAHPGDVWLNHHLSLALRLVRSEESDRLALRHAHVAMALGPESPFLRDQLVALTLELGRREEALELIDGWRGQLDDARIGELAGRLEHEDAVALLSSVLTERPRSLELRLDLIAEHVRAADFEAAEDATRAALAELGSAVPLVCALGELLLEQGRLDEAARVLADAGVDEESRRLRERIARLRRAIALGGPLDMLTRLERARVHQRRGEDAAARAEWLDVLASGEPEERRGQGLGPPIGAGRAAGPGRGLGLGLARRIGRLPAPSRPPRQDALAALVADLAARPELAAETLAVMGPVLDRLAAECRAGDPRSARELAAMREDRRLPPLFDRLERELPAELGARLAAVRELLRTRPTAPPGPAGPPEDEPPPR